MSFIKKIFKKSSDETAEMYPNIQPLLAEAKLNDTFYDDKMLTNENQPVKDFVYIENKYIPTNNEIFSYKNSNYNGMIVEVDCLDNYSISDFLKAANEAKLKVLVHYPNMNNVIPKEMLQEMEKSNCVIGVSFPYVSNNLNLNKYKHVKLFSNLDVYTYANDSLSDNWENFSDFVYNGKNLK